MNTPSIHILFTAGLWTLLWLTNPCISNIFNSHENYIQTILFYNYCRRTSLLLSENSLNTVFRQGKAATVTVNVMKGCFLALLKI